MITMAGTAHVLSHTCSLPVSHNHSFLKNPLPQNLILPLKPRILKPLVLKAVLSPENTPLHPPFTKSEDGYLYCEGRRVDEIMELVQKQSFYLYSKPQITRNFQPYQDALEGLPSIFIGYAVEANNNHNILQHLKNLGSGAVLDNGKDLKRALLAGFDPTKCIFHAYEKTLEDLILAAEAGVFVNIDCEFDLENTVAAARIAGKRVNILLRIIREFDPRYPHFATGWNSKFDIRDEKLKCFLDAVKEHPAELKLVGAHCRVGGTMNEVETFRDLVTITVNYIDEIRARGFEVDYLNIGRKYGVGYPEHLPKPRDLIDTVRELVLSRGIKLVIEPGRSLVANTCCLVTRVIDVKTDGFTNFILTDGTVRELEPCVFAGSARIELASPAPANAEIATFDIVGALSEMLVELPTPAKGAGLVVHNAGAYCLRMLLMHDRIPTNEYWIEEDGSLSKIKDVDFRRPHAYA